MWGSWQFDSPVDVEPLDPKLGDDVWVVDEGLIFRHIVSYAEM
jgi:hypothetical protein